MNFYHNTIGLQLICYKNKKEVTNSESCITVKLRHKKQLGDYSSVNTVTQTMLYRQVLINYANKYDVAKATIRYKINRQYVYLWIKRYDRTLQYLADKSHRPYYHPNQHTEEKIIQISQKTGANGC